MPSQVLGKVSVTPKGDYNAGTTYYALDIVGYEGGSYLAMKEVTGVEPSNDQVNWMQLSGPGLPGKNGTNGVTFTPSVSEAGVISWTNDGEEENPDPVDIMGPPGTAAGFGTVTATADNTSSETPSVDVQSSGPDTARNFTFAFSGLKGKSGDTPDIEIGTVTTLEPDQDATADITGTTPNLSLSLGIPKGQPGTSVSRIQRTSGTGAAGTTDTYTMYDSNDDAIGTFTVYNGTNGAGAGDFLSDGSVPMTGNLDMNGNRVTEVGTPTADTDAANKAYVDDTLESVTITTDETPTQGSTNPVQSGGVFDALSNKQDTLTGTEDQLVGFNSAGEATAVSKPTYTATDVGAMPAVSGGTAGQVLTKTEAGQEWQNAPDGLPSGGEEGQVLTKTASGAQWDDIPSDLPAGGTDGQILTKTADGVAWEDAPEGGVTSFNSRTGAITPQAGDYTAEMVGAVSEADVGVANGVATLDESGKLTGAQKPTYTAADVGALPAQTGTQGQVLGFTSDNVVGPMDAPGGLPDGGTTGQMLYKGASGAEWGDKPVMYVTATYSSPQNYTTDKSSTEIIEAYNSGYSVFLVFTVMTSYCIARLSLVNSDVNVAHFDIIRNGKRYIFAVTNNAAAVSEERLESNSSTVILTATGWTGSAAPFSQQVSCSIVAADTAVVAVDVDTPGTDADADAEAINAWALCTQQNPTQGAGTLTFYCTEKPTINILVKVGVA